MPGGRKPYNWRGDLQKIEEMAASGLRDKEIFTILRVSPSTFYKYKNRKKEFTEALERGRANVHQELADLALKSARSGEMADTRFLLRTRFGYRDTGPIPAGEESQAPPGALTFINDGGSEEE